jgi:signal transduction histidine kinase
VKFTERGAITLAAASAANGGVEITVADSGIGIPAADQQAIFEPFLQAHDRERRAPGAGLGLSIAARLAVLMGGTLSVESTLGRGSRFTLALQGPADAQRRTDHSVRASSSAAHHAPDERASASQ